MRGFDEEAFFATTYAFTGLEYRFILDEFAYAAVFTDWAAFRNQTILAAPSFVSSIGIGLSLGSEKGSFKLNYALGSYLGQPYQLNAGKIHLAYISYF
jgi:outer membrane protein assembly factor BamA